MPKHQPLVSQRERTHSVVLFLSIPFTTVSLQIAQLTLHSPTTGVGSGALIMEVVRGHSPKVNVWRPPFGLDT
jgi:hypothetical protein